MMNDSRGVSEGLDHGGYWRRLPIYIHGFFNNYAMRKLGLRLRLPLALMTAVIIVGHSRREWFAYAVSISFLGELLQLWCFSVLEKNKELTTRGPYTLVRNPMYLARYLVILGFMLLLGKLWLAAGYTIVYYFYMVNRVGREEARLMALFPETYPLYRDWVGRFIPGIKPHKEHSLWHFNWRLLVKNHGHWNGMGVLAFYLTDASYLFRSIKVGCNLLSKWV